MSWDCPGACWRTSSFPFVAPLGDLFKAVLWGSCGPFPRSREDVPWCLRCWCWEREEDEDGEDDDDEEEEDEDEGGLAVEFAFSVRLFLPFSTALSAAPGEPLFAICLSLVRVSILSSFCKCGCDRQDGWMDARAGNESIETEIARGRRRAVQEDGTCVRVCRLSGTSSEQRRGSGTWSGGWGGEDGTLGSAVTTFLSDGRSGGGGEARRAVTWTLSLSEEVWLWGRVRGCGWCLAVLRAVWSVLCAVVLLRLSRRCDVAMLRLDATGKSGADKEEKRRQTNKETVCVACFLVVVSSCVVLPSLCRCPLPQGRARV